MPLSWVETTDGSWSLYDSELNELQHNRAGAYTEALINYVQPARIIERLKTTKSLVVLDSFFGLGMNTWVLLEEVLNEFGVEVFQSGEYSLRIIGIEINPELPQYWSRVLEDPRLGHIKEEINGFEHNTYYQTQLEGQQKRENPLLSLTIKPNMTVKVLCQDTQDWLSRNKNDRNEGIDVIFHDAYAPKKVPELWSADLFSSYREILNNDGTLLTYSGSKSVREELQNSGFLVEATPVVGNKRGGTAATIVK